jgi:hypothetical protein
MVIFLNSLGEIQNNPLPLKSKFTVLNKDTLNIISKHKPIIAEDFEKALVLKERHRNTRLYDKFIEYIKSINKNLKDEGRVLLHTIGDSVSTTTTDPWMNKYIVPGGQIPSLQQLSKSWENILTIQDLHNIGLDYDLTLMTWYENFKQAWPELKDKYGEDFYRLWEYYLLSCAGSFRSGYLQLWQIVLTKQSGILERYEAVR